MFWGLIMEPNKKYTQTVEKSFHLSMASLDASACSANVVQVMILYDTRTYLMCTLEKGKVWQVPLDLNFQEGTKIAFTCNGGGHVHLTGYLIPDELDDELDEFEGEEEEEDEISELVTQKRKASDSPKENLAKKAKQINLQKIEDDDDDDSSDDEDGLELDGENDSEDGLDDEDDEEDESDESDEIEEEMLPPPKKSKTNQQQQQQQQNKKQEKQKPTMNGKESKQEQGKQKKNKDDSRQSEKSEPQQKKKTISGGVQIEELVEGSGSPAKPGKFVSVHYVGRLKNGKKFDSHTQGEGFKFRLGKGEVIKGWDIGIAGMKVGGKRRLVIPPAMAYGAKGSPPVIPGNSTLNFEVELKRVH